MDAMKKIQTICLFIGVLLTTVSCFKLEQNPYETLAEDAAFKTPADAQAWVTGMYNKLRNSVQDEAVLYAEIQADLVHQSLIGDESIAHIYDWTLFTASNGIVKTIWKEYYLAINNIDLALEGFNAIPNQDEIAYNRGELLLARAWYYSRLASLFCENYDEATAQTTLGLPLVSYKNLEQATPRASLKETYEYILNDIEKAYQLLEDEDGSDKTIFTQNSAKALKARVLLAMNRWEQAYENATSLIDSGMFPLLQDENSLQDFWYNDDASESITQLVASTIELPSTTPLRDYLLRDEWRGEVLGHNPKLLPTQTIVDLFEDNDIRKTTYFSQKEIMSIQTGEMANLYLVHKFPGNKNLKVGNETSYAHAPKVFRIGEMYAIAMEAAYKKGDSANALRYLNELKQARGGQEVSVSGQELFQEIKNERTRELAFEGFRLFDLKRWKQDLQRGEPQNENFIITENPQRGYQLKRSANDYKFVWPIPSEMVNYDTKTIKQNKGW